MRLKRKRSLPLKILNFAFFILVVLTITFMLLGMIRRDVDYAYDSDTIQEWNEGWIVSCSSSSSQEMNLPVDLNCPKGELITLENTLPQIIREYNCVMIESKRQEVEVYVGDKLRKSYTNQGQSISESLPFYYVIVPLYSGDGLSKIKVTLSTDSYYSGDIGTIYLGNEMSIVLMLIKSNIVWLALIGVIFIMGVICLVSYEIYKKSFDGSVPLIYLFWFTVFTTVWCFSQLNIRQVFVADIPLLESIGHCGFLLIPITIVLAIDYISGNSHGKIAQILLACSMINFLAQNIIHTGMGIDYFELQPITQIFILTILVMALVLITIDIKR